MVKTILAVLVLLVALPVAGSTVELADSPVHEAMRAAIGGALHPALFAGKSDDEFGDEKPAAKPKEAAETPKTGHKSLYKAALLSAIVPGGGQYYLGNKRAARYFFVAEAATWVAYFSWHTYGNWKKDDYVRYAAERANAQLEGKSEEFLSWVGFYDNIREFNNLGRVSDPERAYLFDTPANHWEWQNQGDRRTYRDLRNSSKEAYRRSDFMIAAAVVDRIISIIGAVRSASHMGRSIESEDFSAQPGSRFKFEVDPLASRQICLTLYPGF